MATSSTVNGPRVPEIPLSEFEGEPRARDLDLAERLGFTRPRTIRQLIERNATEIATFGACCTVQHVVRGNPVTEYLLNEEQALLVATLSNAPNAAAVRAMLIKTFVAWRRGHLSGSGTVFDDTVTDLSVEVRSALGDIVKPVVHRELAIIVPAAVEAALMADPRRAVLDYVSVRQMLDAAKALTKGRNSLNRRFGHDLRRRALILSTEGCPQPARKCPHSGVWLYQRDFADTYMRDWGIGLVADHNAAQTGQGVIVFPDRRGKQH